MSLCDSSDFLGGNRHLFLRLYWTNVLEAFLRYFRRESFGVRALPINEHRENVELAKKLYAGVSRAVHSFPHGFAPSYDALSSQLDDFLKSSQPPLIPKRSHAKSARQALIRELLVKWFQCSSQAIAKYETDISPIEHILHLTEAVCSETGQDVSDLSYMKKLIVQEHPKALIAAGG
jgi:hypothetical protein